MYLMSGQDNSSSSSEFFTYCEEDIMYSMRHILMYKTVSELETIISLITDTETLKALYSAHHLNSIINILLCSIFSYYFWLIYILIFYEHNYASLYTSINPSYIFNDFQTKLHTCNFHPQIFQHTYH